MLQKRITGVIENAMLPVASSLILEGETPTCIFITSNPANLDSYSKDLAIYAKILAPQTELQILTFPESPPRALNETSKKQRYSQRLSVLLNLINSHKTKTVCIVTTPEALFGDFPINDSLVKESCHLSVGASHDFNELVERLSQKLNYDAEATCETIGEIAVRGGIIDIFPINSDAPYRIDFFGDEIESIRLFDPASQKSKKHVEAIHIPANLIEEHKEDSILSYLKDTPISWIFDNPSLIERDHPYRISNKEDSNDSHTLNFLLNNRKKSNDRTISISEFNTTSKLFLDAECIELKSTSLTSFRKKHLLAQKQEQNNDQLALNDFFNHVESKYKRRKLPNVHCFIQNEINRELIQDTVELIPIKKSIHLKLIPSEIDRNCFIAPCPDIKLLNQGHIQILENDLLEESVQTKKEPLHESQVLNLLDFSELVNGDLLVHLQHGLCRYRGITNIELEGNESEVISVEFDQSMLLHVPIREAHLLTRYLGLTKKHPKLAKIGTNQWIKTRTNAEHATLDYASKLLKIYAEREKIKGFAFPKDHPWQSIFEDGFPHKETRDQLSAIKEVKSDMEKSKPMDRLICGDVGYGKTEVAIRACFKAVMAGKQVAILVPTTVLCQQHYNHILERMNEFPVEIAMLSGFNSNQKNKKVLEALQSGKIDLIIGTHRLLSKDVTFSNLGLMVIDEEQRFGVKQKEKIKELAKNVDILTLTATPIPRTLHLALSGARSMSVIETPPIDRKPIETIVKSYDLDVICNAITYETLRGGQVFYLHNKVETIESVAQTLRELLPNLKIAVGHGQMEEGILEKVMVQFINGTFDVLVCTTIIESGIDIPNCNTLIIEGADRFGLAQLYQIRGRVGRFNKQAFAYLFLHRHVALVESAHKRLSTLKQYNQLGAGFKIAMRDLELRGAGNLLGAEQSGHITGIGFELYCQLLKESIARLMNAPGSEQIWAEVDLDFLIYGENTSSSKNKKLQPRPLIDTQEENTTIKKACAAIPKSYITEASYRIYFHRAFSMAKDLNKLRSIQSELIDRFGKLPEEVVLLISVHKIRIQASRAGFKSIRTEGDLLKCSYAHTKNKYYKIGSRFPRLTKSITKLRLNEIYNFIKQIKK